MTRDPDEDDIPVSISSIDTDMGLDMDFDGGYVVDYKSSIRAINQVETGRTYGKDKRKYPSTEDTKKPTQ